MDLGSLISHTATTMKKNWPLLVPPILTQVVLPLAMLTIAAFTIFPLGMAYALTGDFWSVVRILGGGIIVLATAGFLFDTFVTAGWAYMNRCAVTDGKTSLGDLLPGAKKYFLRILGGRLLVGFLMLVPVLAAMGVFLLGLSSLNLPTSAMAGELTPLEVVDLLGPLILGFVGILLVVALVELVLSIFFFSWTQALVVDNLNVWQSVKASIRFARRNFATILGYIVLSAIAWILVSWLTSMIWPSVSYSQLTDPETYANGANILTLLLGTTDILYWLASSVLSAFFMLLLFAIYVDRTQGAQQPARSEIDISVQTPQTPMKEPNHRQLAPRGMRYCVNCGATLVSLAVFCPNCGARQPPLGPS